MRRFNRTIALVALLAIAAQTLGCGTILYPERRGHKTGRIDPAVAVLDGVGCLLFIVPGLIAFAVDFATGAIYLPGGRGHARVERIPFAGHDLAHAIAAVEAHGGPALRGRSDVWVAPIEPGADVSLRVASAAGELSSLAAPPEFVRWGAGGAR